MPTLLPADVRACFGPEPGYLNTATVGVPPIAAVAALAAVHELWARGRLAPQDFDHDVRRSRAAWAALCAVPVETVAVGSVVSPLVGLVAAALPDGARVLVAEGEFTSVSFPFLAHADRGVQVEQVRLELLAARVDERTDLVAVSSVQSADGRVADLPALLAAVQTNDARLLLDITQSCGWLPQQLAAVDYVVCGGYKWLLSPRGSAFVAVRPDRLEALRPVAAGWYAGDDPWTSIYGLPLRLARDARRLDVSPAWFTWVGTAVALELLASLPPGAVQEHDLALASRFRVGLGLPPGNSAIVVLDRPDAAARLAAAGVRTAVRAGRVRASFHVYNDEADVDLALDVLTGRA